MLRIFVFWMGFWATVGELYTEDFFRRCLCYLCLGFDKWDWISGNSYCCIADAKADAKVDFSWLGLCSFRFFFGLRNSLLWDFKGVIAWGIFLVVSIAIVCTGMVTLIRFYLLILGRSSLWLKGIYWSIYYKSNQSSSQNILSLSRILSSSSNSSIHLALYFSSISSILYSNYLHIFWTWAISLLVSVIYSRKVTCIFSTFWSLVACSMRLIDNWSLVCFIC